MSFPDIAISFVISAFKENLQKFSKIIKERFKVRSNKNPC
jgi:hypothetical protein